VYSYTFNDLEQGTWYIRVMAMAEGGYTEPSEIVTVNMGAASGVDDIVQTTTPTKIIENGQVFILRNGKRYNLLGGYAQ
jgi:hypothetical protein